MKEKLNIKGNANMLVLRLISEKPRYGYDIIRDLEQRSEGVFTLQEGNLYPILHTLENQGYVVAYWEDTTSKRRRRFYTITESGIQALNNQWNDWKAIVAAMEKLMNGEGGVPATAPAEA